jgi:hypothetical protein
MTEIFTACDQRVCNCPEVVYKGKFIYIIDDYGNMAKFYDIVFNQIVKATSLEGDEEYITLQDDYENEVCMLKEQWKKIVSNHNSKEGKL